MRPGALAEGQRTAMTDPDTPLSGRLLPDAISQAVEPGSAVLRLATTRSREGILDGAWWPRSRDFGSEVPALVTFLTEHLGPLDRIGLDANAWDGIPGSLSVAGRIVHIDWFPVGDDTLIITRGNRDHFVLLVIPPQTAKVAACAAMLQAVDAANTESGEQILITSGSRSLSAGR